MIQRVFVVVAVLICGWGLPAWGGEGYVGLSYMNTDAEFRTVTETFETGSDGWKLFGGYDAMRFFGIELTYYDLGNFSQTKGNSSVDADIKVYDFSGRGILPIGKRVQLFARLGYSTVDSRTTTTNGGVKVTTSVRDWELIYGVGIGVKLGKRFGLRAEWEAWDVETSLESWSVGLVVRFGEK